MTHKMRLHNSPFNLIKNGSKTIELRLYDEKRSIIKIGDPIEFENIKTFDKIITRVVCLHKYSSFDELYKHFNKVSMGYKEDEIADPKDMELYYSKEEQEKYGVVGIEIELLQKSKDIAYNYDDLTFDEINRVVKRAKIVIENDNEELILCHSNKNYFLLGGHVDDNEDDISCLNRELLEEAGIDIMLDYLFPFFTIRYLNRDYPEEGTNTLSIANYYKIKMNLKPNLSNINLTEEEKKGNFELVFIKRQKVLNLLNEALNTCTRRGVVEDTIEVLKEYLND